MLYYLIEWLERTYQPPGFQIINFITVRAALAAFTSLVLSLLVGKRVIRWLERNQFGERIREGQSAGAVSHAHKAGTPTMGGIIIIGSILGGTLLWGAIGEIYVAIALLATTWMGVFGLADDYIKVVKGDKEGLAKRTKLIGQLGIGIIVGVALYFHPQFADMNTLTHLPFVKSRVFDYNIFDQWIEGIDLGWVVYIPVVIFIMTAVSNGVNLTDGLDGLAAGVTAFVSVGILALAYVSGNVNFASFLDVLYLPGAGELTVFAAAMTAACFGFLWYNGYPAQVFMGDTGALALGAAVASQALMVKKELLLPLLCGVFFMETLSVIIQTSYFRYTRIKTGKGKRVFLMAPLHHHYEAKGIHESKIVIRFWIATSLLVIFTLLTLRIR